MQRLRPRPPPVDVASPPGRHAARTQTHRSHRPSARGEDETAPRLARRRVKRRAKKDKGGSGGGKRKGKQRSDGRSVLDPTVSSRMKLSVSRQEKLRQYMYGLNAASAELEAELEVKRQQRSELQRQLSVACRYSESRMRESVLATRLRKQAGVTDVEVEHLSSMLAQVRAECARYAMEENAAAVDVQLSDSRGSAWQPPPGATARPQSPDDAPRVVAELRGAVDASRERELLRM